MLNFIDVREIISENTRSLKNYREARRQGGYDNAGASRPVYFLIYGAPIIIAVIALAYFLYSGSGLNGNTTGVLVSIFAVFSGFLLNVLVLMHRVVVRSPSDSSKERNENSSEDLSPKQLERERLLKRKRRIDTATELPRQTYANISYSVLVCVSALVVLFLISLTPLKSAEFILSSLVVFFLFHFVIMLLIVLKRMHKIVYQEFN